MKVFLSYASVDDLYVKTIAESGWVTSLLTGLRIKLAQKLGRQEVFEVWRDDERLKHHEPFPDQLLAAVRECDVIVAILSKGYLKSAWCGREIVEFLESHGPSAANRVFVVERDEAARTDRPEGLKDLLGYTFWTKTAGRATTLGDPVVTRDDREYFSTLDGLGQELADKLEEIERIKQGGGPVVPDGRPYVYLAWTTDDLNKRRRELRQYLLNNGVGVLPEKQYPLSRDEFAAAVKEDLVDAMVFVQLISDEPGYRPDDVREGFPALQLELAREAGVRLLRWHPTDIDRDAAAPEVRPLLEGSGLVAEMFEAFKDHVIAEARRPVKPPGPPPGVGDRVDDRATIFVNYDQVDAELARNIDAALKAQNVGTSLAIYDESWSAEEKARDLEASLIHNDTMLCVYARANRAWVRSQLYEAKRIQPRRATPFAVLCVYQDQPTPPKPGFELNWKSITILSQDPESLSPAAFAEFVGLLEAGRPSHV